LRKPLSVSWSRVRLVGDLEVEAAPLQLLEDLPGAQLDPVVLLGLEEGGHDGAVSGRVGSGHIAEREHLAQTRL